MPRRTAKQRKEKGPLRRNEFRPQAVELERRWMLSAYTVDDPGDAPLDMNKPPGETSDGTITLRSAIEQINIDGSGTITFAGGMTVSVESQLDPITASGVTIDGGTVGTVVVSGGPGYNGLVVDGGGATIQNLVINSFGGAGIVLDSSGDTVQNDYIGTDASGSLAVANDVGVWDTVGGNTIQDDVVSGNLIGGIILDAADDDQVYANMIGTDPTGEMTVPNGGDGVSIRGGASDNTIGGTTDDARNLIDGNTYSGVAIFGQGCSHNIVEGNYIGVDASGTTALGNTDDGVSVFAGPTENTIGGTAQGAGNLISGNGAGTTFGGVDISDSGTSGNLVVGNLIGTDVTGTNALPNDGGVGIFAGASGNTVGGTTSAARNIIAGNLVGNGVGITGAGTNDNLVEGNYIGTTISGDAILSNAGSGVGIGTGASSNTIGGTAAGAGNLISGNGSGGVAIGGLGASGNLVEGNLIGTDANSATGLGNGGVGVSLFAGATANTVGGTSPAAANVIAGNAGDGVDISGTGTSGNLIEGNFIGTDGTGTKALGNSADGVQIFGGSSNNTIGGTTPAERNVISANAGSGVAIQDQGSNDNLVEGDYIGVDSSGEIGLGNLDDGVSIFGGASGNTIGGTAQSAGNLISGNGLTTTFGGVDMSGSGTSGNLVEGNLIGTDVTGTIAVPNDGGVGIFGGASGNTVGGTTSAARNIIAGNTAYNGVGINGAGTNDNLVDGNYIGTDISGTAVLSNAEWGVAIVAGASSNTIGGTTQGAGNLISGNGTAGAAAYGGVGISDSGTSGNLVQGNLIGTDVTGSLALPNGAGVQILNGASANTIGGSTTGSGNVVSGNNGDGVVMSDQGTSDNLLEGNMIGTDVTGQVPLGNAGAGVSVLDNADANTIGGSTTAAGNTIAANGSGLGVAVAAAITPAASGSEVAPGSDARPGIDINGVNGAVVQSNTLGGSFFHGTETMANAGDGIRIEGGATNTLVGGPQSDQGNIISGNAENGIEIIGANTTSTTIQNCIIRSNGSVAADVLSNGVLIALGAHANTIGGSADGGTNCIYGNSGDGVVVTGVGTDQNVVAGSWIGLNPHGVAVANGGDGVLIASGAQGNTVGGTVSGAGDVISGNSAGNGIAIVGDGTNANVVECNKIGTDPMGNGPLPNGGDGVLIGSGAQHNIIGTVAENVSNIISGNIKSGVVITGRGTSDNALIRNVIGFNGQMTLPVPNGRDGVLIDQGAESIAVGGTNSGEGNVIAGNAGNGITVGDSATDTAQENAILGNSISENGKLGIDLGNNGVTLNNSSGHTGPNLFQNFPVLSLATIAPAPFDSTEVLSIMATLTAAPNSTYRVEFFANASADPAGYGEGRKYLGSCEVPIGPLGMKSFKVQFVEPPGVVAVGQSITATATDPAGNTSEFSADELVTRGIMAIATIAPLASSSNPPVNDQPFRYSAIPVTGSGSAAPMGTTAFIDASPALVPVAPPSGTTSPVPKAMPAGLHANTALFSNQSQFTASAPRRLRQAVRSSKMTDTIAAATSRLDQALGSLDSGTWDESFLDELASELISSRI
jgi:hypothetical protein